jgi:hypothetical protein
MKWFIIKIVSLCVIGLFLSELHTLIYYIKPETANIELDLWMDKSYHQKLSVLWYVYELNNRLSMIIWFYAFAKCCQIFSNKLFNIILVFVLYFITQFAFWIWDRNTIFFSNFIVYAYMAIAIMYLFIPSKKGGKLINIEDYFNT